MTIGWGIIGIGNHAGRFVAPALKQAADTSLVAVCSRSSERAQDFAARFSAKRWYDSYEKMLQDAEVDVVYVATPNFLHEQHTVQAAEAGKHVLCEKPMAATEEECRRMIDVCEKHGVRLGVDFQNRYHPAHREARRLVRNGTVGDIKVAKAQYCHGSMKGRWQGWRNDPVQSGAGALVGTGIHPIDLLRFVLDSEIEEVQAVCAIQTPYHAVDEMVYAILKFENGTYGVAISGILAPRSDDDLVLYGTRAKVVGKGTVGMPLRGELLVEGDSINLKMAFPVTDPLPWNYVYVIEAFNRWITAKTESDISGMNGLQMVRITNAILESSRQGKAIRIRNQS